jgi:hypothetical protein
MKMKMFAAGMFVAIFGLGGSALVYQGTSSLADRAHAEALQDGFYLTQTDSKFSDAVLDLESAIINRGLVIDYKGMIGDMLSRTSDAVGSKSPYQDAVYMQFCSAKHTHEAVSADPHNIAICPYVVFAYQLTGSDDVEIGYRRPIGVKSPGSDTALAEIDKLLQDIVDEAAD